ncbi:hypothetical protein [Lactococcus lactis]
MYLGKTYSVSGVIHDKNKLVYADKKVELGDENVETDDFGQFFTHIHPYRWYQVKNKGINYAIYTDKKGNIKIRGDDGTSGIKLKSDKVKMNVKPGVAYINTSEYLTQYSSSTHELVLKSPFQFSKGDKLIISPDGKSTGNAFMVKSEKTSNGKTFAKVEEIATDQVLTQLQIHTGVIKGSDLGKTSNSYFVPTDTASPFIIKKSAQQHYDIVKSISFKREIKGTTLYDSYDTDDYSINSKGDTKVESTLNADIKGSEEFNGTLQINAVFDFINPSKTFVHIENDLTVKNQLSFSLNGGVEGESQLLLIPTEVSFVKIPVDLYYDTSLNLNIKFNETVNYNSKMDLDFSHHASPKKTESNPEYSVSGSGGMSGEVGLKVGPEIVCFGSEKLIEAYGKCGFNGSVDIEGEFSSSNSKPAISKSGDLDLEGSLGIEAPVIDKLHSLFYPKVKWKTDSASISLFSISLLKSPPSNASSDVASNDNSSTDTIEPTVNNQSNSDFGEGFGGLIALLFILGFLGEWGKRR